MATYLFCTSDQARQPKRLPQLAHSLGTDKALTAWRIGCYRRPKPGDRFFLIRTAGNAPGLIGAGRITSRPFSGKHPRYPAYRSNYVGIEFEKLVAKAPAVLLGSEELKEAPFDAQYWQTRSSGIRIKPEVARALEDWLTP